jgi:hypothetical protein
VAPLYLEIPKGCCASPVFGLFLRKRASKEKRGMIFITPRYLQFFDLRFSRLSRE